VISQLTGDRLEIESTIDPIFHVRGATKVYRRQCWLDLEGLIAAPGWDTLDEVKANMKGWSTQTFRDLPVVHHRPAGAAYGKWNDWVKGGLANYVVGYDPVFMAVKCLRRMFHPPYGLGGCALFYGFCKGYITQVPQIDDRSVIEYLRRQQWNRLLLRPSLWDR
jgi:poly-beta-1,6-N-acetyl-D-glucosamine synthase